MTIRFREVDKTDWNIITWLASDDVQEADNHGAGDVWVQNRLGFTGDRRDAVAEVDGRIEGYCAIERAPDAPMDAWRIFIVADWDEGNAALHEALFEKACAMLADVQAKQAWLRELTGDARLIQFVTDHGFAPVKRYVFDGREMVNLERELS